MSKPYWNENKQRWELCIYENRKRVHTFTSTKKGTAGKNECIRKRTEWLSGEPTKQYQTVNSQWEKFMANARAAKKYRPEYADRLDYDYSHYVKPLLGGRKLTSVTINEWQHCLDSARKQDKDNSYLSEKSLRSIKNSLSQFFKYCRRDGLPMPVAEDLEIPKTVKKPTEKPILNEDQMAAIFDDNQPFSHLYYIPYIRFALATGCRPGEILGLKYEDYDGTFCTIRRSINTHKTENEGGKTENAVRKIALSSLAKAAIVKQIEQTKGLNSEYIFCRPDGGVASSAKINLRFKKLACEKLGADKDITLYCCRHTFISYASRILPESALKPLVGHSVSMPTLATYQHTTDQMLIDVANALDQKKFE